MELQEIGHIHTGFSEKFGIPRQSGLVKGLKGRIVLEPEFRNTEILRGLDGYSYLWIIWGFSEARKEHWSATVAPPRLGGKRRMGVFATRSPFRPNPIGLSSVKLECVTWDEKLGPVIDVSGIDMLDGTPIYDMKPYLPHVDSHPDARGGFAADVKEHNLSVCIADRFLQIIETEERENVIQLLEQDPRTAFIHDEERIWGISYHGYNIRFQVCEETLTVVEVTIVNIRNDECIEKEWNDK